VRRDLQARLRLPQLPEGEGRVVTELDLDAIDALANAVQHHRVGPARCACGYDAYKVGGFFPDYHAMFMAHLDAAGRIARGQS
jgi:hypothetical protein